jgi:hypothetical protein
MDGQVSGVNAYEGHLHDYYINRNIDILKYATECSMDQQANDKGYLHSSFKLFNKKLYETDESEDDKKYVSPTMLSFINGKFKDAGFDPSSFKTYSRFLKNIQACLQKCCTNVMVRQGWVMASTTIPPNWITMLN